MIIYGCGKMLRVNREKLGLSLLDVSKRTGLAKSNLSSIELNKRNVSVNILYKILIDGLLIRPDHSLALITSWQIMYMHEYMKKLH